jgi:N-methylhydantoinase A
MSATGSSRYLIGIDVGGTFTDLVLVRDAQLIELVKVPSDPGDLVSSVVSGLKILARRRDLGLEEVLGNLDRLVHGSTVAANALLERKGARMGFITTAGFRDTLVMRRMFRENMYDTRAREPEPLVGRNNILEVRERVDRDGGIIEPVAQDDLEHAIDVIESRKLESVGVCFLFSFRNPKHELAVRDRLEQRLPNLYVSTSIEVCPEIRDYERACTTHLNAYLRPPVDRYLRNLNERLTSFGMSGDLQVMESNGGVSDPITASRRAVNQLLSGPAGGVIGSAYWGEITGCRNMISFDMGGTSCDISLIRDGTASLSTPVTSTATHCKFEGWDVLIPFIDIHTIGSGGGSVAWVDEGGGMHVGPHSMGATPGPACYGKGGEEPTVTDADVVLGYIDPDYYLGGEIPLRPERADSVIRRLADVIGSSVTEAADGIFHIVNVNMMNGVRVVSVERGHDPREFALFSFGGAGAVHATALMNELGVENVIIPQLASGFSAYGLLCTDLHRDYVHTVNRMLADVEARQINEVVEEMVAQGRKHFAATRAAGKIWAECIADMRYKGQAHDIRVPIIVPVASVRDIITSFNHTYRRSYGYLLEEDAIQLINLRVSVYNACSKPVAEPGRIEHSGCEHAMKGKRQVYFSERRKYVATNIYDGHSLKPGSRLEGPGIVELRTTNIVVRPDQTMNMDSFSNFIIARNGVRL